MEIVDIPVRNGQVEVLGEEQAQPRLPGISTRRLLRLSSELVGAASVAQAAVNAHNIARDNYERAFMEACEDVGLVVPSGQHDVAIDWATGAVRFTPK